MGIPKGDPRQAHHIIPRGKSGELIVQQAAKDPRAFHIDEALNGIPLDKAVHSGAHNAYDNKIQQKGTEGTKCLGNRIFYD